MLETDARTPVREDARRSGRRKGDVASQDTASEFSMPTGAAAPGSEIELKLLVDADQLADFNAAWSSRRTHATRAQESTLSPCTTIRLS
jgi:hypothetical protein